MWLRDQRLNGSNLQKKRWSSLKLVLTNVGNTCTLITTAPPQYQYEQQPAPTKSTREGLCFIILQQHFPTYPVQITFQLLITFHHLLRRAFRQRPLDSRQSTWRNILCHQINYFKNSRWTNLMLTLLLLLMAPYYY